MLTPTVIIALLWQYPGVFHIFAAFSPHPKPLPDTIGRLYEEALSIEATSICDNSECTPISSLLWHVHTKPGHGHTEEN